MNARRRWSGCRGGRSRERHCRIDGARNRLADELDATIANANRRDVCSRHVLEPHRMVLEPQTSLRLQVGHVHRLRREEKMVGIHASSLVAAMTDHRARRNRALPGDPGQPMGEIVAIPETEVPVTVVVEPALPDEAARNGVGPGVVVQALCRRPLPVAGGQAWATRARRSGHAHTLRVPNLDHLLWALAFANRP